MLTINHLYKSYATVNQTYPVLKDVSFEVGDGEFVAVMGPSGSGKTTLLNCISCYIPINQGNIILKSKDISKMNERELATIRNENLGFVFQDFMLLDGLTVMENIMLPRIIKGRHMNDMETEAKKLLKTFGIDHIAHKYPADISGGEKQRTAVARALMNQPDLVLADEPTGNLDSKASRNVIESFRQAKEKMGATIFMVTHDSFAASFCDRVIILKDGCVYSILYHLGNREQFQDELLQKIKEMSGENV